jgi:hypothetical protein
VLVAVALYAVLPEPLLVGPRFLIPGLLLGLVALGRLLGLGYLPT